MATLVRRADAITSRYSLRCGSLTNPSDTRMTDLRPSAPARASVTRASSPKVTRRRFTDAAYTSSALERTIGCPSSATPISFMIPV